MTDIFVSYASEDRQRIAPLVAELQNRGFDVWWDQQIRTGSAYDAEIEQAIEKASCVLVLWSKKAITSEWVRNEAMEGLERNMLVPVMLDDVRVPLAFRRMQSVQLHTYPNTPDASAIARLISAIERKIGPRGPSDERTAAVTTTAERREISILSGQIFSLSGVADPEDLAELQNRARNQLSRLSELYGGILNQMVNNRFSVIFGLPVAHEEDATRAVHLALAIPEELHALESDLGLANASQSARISVATGLVVAAPGSAESGLYTLSGECTGIADALIEAAAPGQVLLAEETVKQAGPYFNTVRQAPTSLGGVEQNTYLLTGRSNIQTRIDAASARGFSRYSGRSPELALAETQARAALSGNGRVITLIGDAGIGKSRFTREITGALANEPFLLLEGTCQSYGVRSPYLPMLEVLEGLLRQEEIVDDPEQTMLNALVAYDLPLEAIAPSILHLFSIVSKRYPAPELDGLALKSALQNAVVATLTHTSRRKPIMLLLEDWHWSDSASDDVLQTLIDTCARFPIFILITARPEYQPRWLHHPHASLIHLLPLSVAETGALAASWFGTSNLPPELAQRIHETTDGNPFFIEEICRSLKEKQQVKVLEDIVYFDDIGKLDLPSSIQAVIRSRLDQLDEGTREILNFASTIGREFRSRMLEKMASRPVDQALNALVDLAIVQQTELLPESVFEFRHALTQVVVYESLLRGQRKQIHERIGRAIEALNEDGAVEEEVEMLAYHFSRGEDITKAIEYTLRAGERAAERSAIREAASHFGSAARLISERDEKHTDVRQQLRAHINLGTALMVVKGYGAPEVIHSFSQALELCEKVERSADHFLTFWGLWRYYYNRGLIGQAADMSTKLLATAQEENDSTLLLAAHTAQGIVLLLSARLAEASTHLQEALDNASTGDRKAVAVRYGMSPETMSLSFLAVARANQGMADEALELAERACQLADEIEHEASSALAHYYAVTVAILLGDKDFALRHSETLNAVATAANFPHWIALADFQSAVMEALGGSIESAADKMRHAKDKAVDLGVGLLRPTYAFTFVPMSASLGREAEARAELEVVERALQEGGLDFFLADLNRSKALMLKEEDPDQAESLFRLAIAQSERSGSNLTKLRAATEFAMFLSSRGHTEDAAPLLEEALADFGTCGNQTAAHRHAIRQLEKLKVKVNDDHI